MKCLITKFFNFIYSIEYKEQIKIVTIFGKKKYLSRFDLQKIQPFQNNKPTIAMQVYSMDKGGLEEVVLQLATNKNIRDKYNIVIITEKSNDGYLAKIATKNGIPVYSFFGDFEKIDILVKLLNIKIVHYHYNVTGAGKYKYFGVKTLYTIHNNYIWFDKITIEHRLKNYEYIDKFVAVSSQVKEYFCEKFGIDKSNVDIIVNGTEYIDENKVISIKKTALGCRKDDFVFLNVASFNPIKYHYSQISALANLHKKYPNIKLVILGNISDKEYYNDLIRYIKENGMTKHVRMCNYVPKKDVYKYIKMADCFIMTSLSEGFSIAKLEAMLFNKPLILTDVGGARDVITNNDIGIVVPNPYDSIQNLNIKQVNEDYKNGKYNLSNLKEIIAAMENIYLNKSIWNKRVNTSSNKVKNEFNLQKVCTKYADIYQELLDCKKNI